MVLLFFIKLLISIYVKTTLMTYQSFIFRNYKIRLFLNYTFGMVRSTSSSLTNLVTTTLDGSLWYNKVVPFNLLE